MSMYRSMQNPDTPDLPFAQSVMELATLQRSSSKYEGTRIQDYIDYYEDKKEKKRLEEQLERAKRNPDGTYTEEFLISKGKQRPLYEVGGICNCGTCAAGGCCHPVMRCAAARPPSSQRIYGTKLSRTPIQRQSSTSTVLLALAGVLLLA